MQEKVNAMQAIIANQAEQLLTCSKAADDLAAENARLKNEIEQMKQRGDKMTEDEKAAVLELAKDQYQTTKGLYCYYVMQCLENDLPFPQNLIDTIESLMEEFCRIVDTKFKINNLEAELFRPPLYPEIEQFFDLSDIEPTIGEDLARLLQQKVNQIISEI